MERTDRQSLISRRIMTLIDRGLSPVDACKAVLGADVVDAAIEDIYNRLRAEAH